jgi:hypothetical protein
MIDIPQMLMIGGVQQNVGKTSLACDIIAHFCRIKPIIGLKITPHFHKSTGNTDIIIDNKDFQLLREKSYSGNKDTARMLKAGATSAYLLQSGKDKLNLGIQEFLKITPANSILICESAGLHDIVKPSLFLVLRQLHCIACSIDDEKLFQEADRIVTFTGNGFDFSVTELKLLKNKWLLDNQKND